MIYLALKCTFCHWKLEHAYGLQNEWGEYEILKFVARKVWPGGGASKAMPNNKELWLVIASEV